MKAMLIFPAVLVGVLLMSSGASARTEIMCTEQYQPVCGAKPVQCIQAPCYPQYQTFGNACHMSAEGATFIHEGECTASETGPWTGGDGSYVPPARCVAWFDGCNQCSRGANGETACTLMACEGDPAPGRCIKYETPAAPAPTPSPAAPPPAPQEVATSTPTDAVPAAKQPGFLESLWQRILSWFPWF